MQMMDTHTRAYTHSLSGLLFNVDHNFQTGNWGKGQKSDMKKECVLSASATRGARHDNQRRNPRSRKEIAVIKEDFNYFRGGESTEI